MLTITPVLKSTPPDFVCLFTDNCLSFLDFMWLSLGVHCGQILGESWTLSNARSKCSSLDVLEHVAK